MPTVNRGIATCYIERYAHIVGKRYNQLTVLSVIDEVHPTTGVPLVLRCDCGVIKTLGKRYLESSNVKTCGCLRRKKSSGPLKSFARIQ